MSKAFKDLILECDFFAHGTLQRYRHGQNFPTLTGGIVSLLCIVLFAGMFSRLTIDTFQNNLIASDLAVTYDDDPSLVSINSSTSNFMFAIGLTGMDFSASKRYFDVELISRMTEKTSSGTSKVKNKISLEPCTLEHWSGISESITNSYTTLGFNQWLCPPLGYTFDLQGKYTSTVFKFEQINIAECTQNNTYFPGTTCYNSTEVTNFLNSWGQFTFNFYYVNTVINAGQKKYISYYLEDRNYFSFDTYTGVSANLFFDQYNINTDITILPWSEYHQDTGAKTGAMAVGQNYRMATGEPHFKFYLRKGAANYSYQRAVQKLDQTLSYIGGLFGTLALLLMFLNLYSKYSYELDFGDRIFKQNNGGSFGSQNFNFVVFIGYLFFVFLDKFGITLNWKTMKRYHKCRTECEKQLDIDLMLRKMAHFEQITKVVMEDHHQKMLLMAPKPTIAEARINRKRFLIKCMIYNQLEKKAGQVHVDESGFQEKVMSFLNEDKKKYDQNEEAQDSDNEKLKHPTTLKNIQGDISKCFKLAKEEHEDHIFTKKIMERINTKQVAQGILAILQFGKHERKKTLNSIKIKKEVVFADMSQNLENDESAKSLFKNNKIAPLDDSSASQVGFGLFNLGALLKSSQGANTKNNNFL